MSCHLQIDVDPDPAYHYERIQIQLTTFMRIWIHNTDPGRKNFVTPVSFLAASKLLMSAPESPGLDPGSPVRNVQHHHRL
jgi:hypothetical protein